MSAWDDHVRRALFPQPRRRPTSAQAAAAVRPVGFPRDPCQDAPRRPQRTVFGALPAPSAFCADRRPTCRESDRRRCAEPRSARLRDRTKRMTDRRRSSRLRRRQGLRGLRRTPGTDDGNDAISRSHRRRRRRPAARRTAAARSAISTCHDLEADRLRHASARQLHDADLATLTHARRRRWADATAFALAANEKPIVIVVCSARHDPLSSASETNSGGEIRMSTAAPAAEPLPGRRGRRRPPPPDASPRSTSSAASR